MNLHSRSFFLINVCSKIQDRGVQAGEQMMAIIQRWSESVRLWWNSRKFDEDQCKSAG
jgi:hypothetical protein